MANESKRYEVLHPKLSMSVNGGLKRLKVGSHILLTDKQVLGEDGEIRQSLKGKLRLYVPPETVVASETTKKAGK